MNDLINRLRAMARCEHDDIGVADEAADEIERLRSLAATPETQRALIEAAERRGYARGVADGSRPDFLSQALNEGDGVYRP